MSFDHEWGLRWPDKVFSPVVNFLDQKAWEWPAWFRRLYLFTLPLAFPIIFILKWALIFTGIMCLIVAFLANYFYCVWHGQKGGPRKTSSF
jgi:hypothetical protein